MWYWLLALYLIIGCIASYKARFWHDQADSYSLTTNALSRGTILLWPATIVYWYIYTDKPSIPFTIKWWADRKIQRKAMLEKARKALIGETNQEQGEANIFSPNSYGQYPSVQPWPTNNNPNTSFYTPYTTDGTSP